MRDILDLAAVARASRLTGFLNPTAFFAVLIWSAIAPFSKYALADFPALSFMAFRMSVASVAVFAYSPFAASRRHRTDRCSELPAGGHRFLRHVDRAVHRGVAHTTVAHMVIISSTSPLLGAVYRWLAKGDRPERRSLVAMMIGFAGVIIVVSDASAADGASVLGDLMGLVSASLWVGMTIYPQPLVKKYGALRSTAWFIAMSLLLIVPLSLPTIGSVIEGPPPSLAWGALLYAAMGTLVGNTLWQSAVQQVGPVRTLVYLYLQPVFLPGHCGHRSR